jgi:hypothetical protein
MVHSTGANNPGLKRYVGPNDGLLGENKYGNHWNTDRPGGRQVCVHAFIGKLADGTVATYQTLPWNHRGWHSGSGSKGSANNTHIGFEICEDAMTDAGYFACVYREAVELVAYLCRHCGLDPLAPGVVICHAEGHRMGIASTHADVEHWFARFGVSMDDFRADVRAALDGEEIRVQGEDFAAAFERYRRSLQDNDHAAWSAQALEWAKEQGLFAGVPGQDGEPNYMWEDFVTREQLAMVLYKLSGG